MDLSGSGKMIIEQSDVESLSITADDNLLPYLTSEVHGSRLSLSTKDFIRPTGPVTYELLVKKLKSISISGGAQIDAKGLATDSLDVSVSGAGDITISGQTDKETVSISGAGKYRADDFKSKSATVDISGIGSAIFGGERPSERARLRRGGSGIHRRPEGHAGRFGRGPREEAIMMVGKTPRLDVIGG